MAGAAWSNRGIWLYYKARANRVTSARSDSWFPAPELFLEEDATCFRNDVYVVSRPATPHLDIRAAFD